MAVVARLAERAVTYRDLVMAGRSHNVAAQATTLGKRFASAAEEMLVALARLRELIDRYPLRGIKGPMGTAQDMLDLFDGDAARLAALERAGGRIPRVFATFSTSVGQVYPRSLDHDVVSALVQLGAGPSSFAHTIRLMAGHELVTEGFAPGQVGSSAMPHKMNTRSCERVNGLQVVLRGYASMAAELAGAQWNEGDVFCSVVRRVALPDAFFAIDGQIETFLTVLDEFGAYPAVIQRELDRYLPFLATTRILIAAVRAGVGPGDRARGDQGTRGRRRAGDAGAGSGARPAGPAWPPTRGCRWIGRRWMRRWRTRQAFTGAAGDQVDAVVAAVDELVGRYPEAAKYTLGRHPVTRWRRSTSPIWTTSPTASRTTLFDAAPARGAGVLARADRAHARRRGLLVGRHLRGNACGAARSGRRTRRRRAVDRPYGGTLLQDLLDRRVRCST